MSLDGEPVRTPSAQMIMVFQSFDQLFPWFTLKENITYALKKAKKGRDKSVREETALGYLDMAGLSGFADSYPHTLSGGMKQRGLWRGPWLWNREFSSWMSPFPAWIILPESRPRTP